MKSEPHPILIEMYALTYEYQKELGKLLSEAFFAVYGPEREDLHGGTANEFSDILTAACRARGYMEGITGLSEHHLLSMRAGNSDKNASIRSSPKSPTRSTRESNQLAPYLASTLSVPTLVRLGFGNLDPYRLTFLQNVVARKLGEETPQIAPHLKAAAIEALRQIHDMPCPPEGHRPFSEFLARKKEKGELDLCPA